MDSVQEHGTGARAAGVGRRSWTDRRPSRSAGGRRGRPVPLTTAAFAAITLALVVCGCGEAASAGPGFAGTSADGSDAPDFTLHDQSGRPVSLAGQRGRWVIVTFLYTRCPDVCPLIASQLNDVLRELGPDRARLRVLAVSVDPRGDTPKLVRWFVQKHRLLPQFRYLTGSAARLAPIWQGYHVAAQVGSPDVSLHSAYELLLDPKGKPQLRYSADLQARDLLGDLRKLGAVG